VIFFKCVSFPHKSGDTIKDSSFPPEFWVGKGRLKGERVHEEFFVVVPLVLHTFKRQRFCSQKGCRTIPCCL